MSRSEGETDRVRNYYFIAPYVGKFLLPTDEAPDRAMSSILNLTDVSTHTCHHDMAHSCDIKNMQRFQFKPGRASFCSMFWDQRVQCRMTCMRLGNKTDGRQIGEWQSGHRKAEHSSSSFMAKGFLLSETGLADRTWRDSEDFICGI